MTQDLRGEEPPWEEGVPPSTVYYRFTSGTSAKLGTDGGRGSSFLRPYTVTICVTTDSSSVR